MVAKMGPTPSDDGMTRLASRKSESIHHHHHHPEGVVYRGVCLNYGAVAVSEITSRRWWCIESAFPVSESGATRGGQESEGGEAPG